MEGAIARSVLGWPWPSVQRDSEALRLRIEWARKVEIVRQRLVYCGTHGRAA